jgi:hypothetical protein
MVVGLPGTACQLKPLNSAAIFSAGAVAMVKMSFIRREKD